MSTTQPDRPGAVPARVSTGIEGFDQILGGGLFRGRLYVVNGRPGSGKTTLGLQFLLEARRNGERALFLTLSETLEELKGVAASHGWSLDGIEFKELGRENGLLSPDSQYTLFHPSEVELNETIKSVIVEVDQFRPTCLVIDPFSELRMMAEDALLYRRHILMLKQQIAALGCAAILLDDTPNVDADLPLQSVAHGAIELQQLDRQYGRERRRLRVLKMRGMGYRGGFHDFTINHGGLAVYPRLGPAPPVLETGDGAAPSGLAALDALLGGGLVRGGSTILMGPSGAGKSSLASLYAVAAASRGERVAFFAFDEVLAGLIARAEGLGLALRQHVEAGLIALHQVDPAELSPGEFACMVEQAVASSQIRMVIIDSLNGYLAAMPEEPFLVPQLHELLLHLAQRGAVTLLVIGQRGMVEAETDEQVDVTYLADAVVLLRYFESAGEIRRAISVVKQRQNRHEQTIREFRLGPSGFDIGQPLKEFQGMLGGMPAYYGMHGSLLSGPGPGGEPGEQSSRGGREPAG